MLLVLFGFDLSIIDIFILLDKISFIYIFYFETKVIPFIYVYIQKSYINTEKGLSLKD